MEIVERLSTHGFHKWVNSFWNICSRQGYQALRERQERLCIRSWHWLSKELCKNPIKLHYVPEWIKIGKVKNQCQSLDARKISCAHQRNGPNIKERLSFQKGYQVFWAKHSVWLKSFLELNTTFWAKVKDQLQKTLFNLINRKYFSKAMVQTKNHKDRDWQTKKRHK